MDGGELVAVLSPTFHQMFPYFLSMGMSYDEYWNQDVTLTRAYRKASELKRDLHNQQAWLQGIYVYEAILCASPILHAFAKKGTKPEEYRSEPIPLREEQRKAAEERQNEKNLKRSLAVFKTWAESQMEGSDGSEPGSAIDRNISE